MTDSLAAELATAPCIRPGILGCEEQERKHPECVAHHLEALRRDNPARLAELLGMPDAAEMQRLRAELSSVESEFREYRERGQ